MMMYLYQLPQIVVDQAVVQVVELLLKILQDQEIHLQLLHHKVIQVEML